NPPGSAKALMSSESMTLMVNGTCESELRTMFCPNRLMYSETTGSLIIFDCVSTCIETCLPSAICRSRLYQFPMPRAQPTLRLPIASMSFMPPSCTTLVADGSAGVGAVLAVVDDDWSAFLFLSAAKDGDERQTATTKAAVSDSKFFISISGFAQAYDPCL